jgi:hypothetical protein
VRYLITLSAEHFFGRYHEHEVEEDRPVCKVEQEQKCKQVTQGYSTSEECSSWPRTTCTLETKKVKKYTPDTACKKVPFQLCGPSACPVEPGREQCFDKKETVVQEVPEEQCTLEPQRECKQVTKLVPLLKPTEECVDIPKEVCVRQRTNPRKIQKPVIKKWCYTPSKESGLAPPRTTTRRPTTRRPGSGDNSGNSNQGGRLPDFQEEEPKGCLAGRPVDYCQSKAGNGRCDLECNIPGCNYDGGDCEPKGCLAGRPVDYCPRKAGNGRCDPECNIPGCGNDGGDCEPKGCLAGRPFDYCPRISANGRCDQECNIRECNYDGGDCRPTPRPPISCAPGFPASHCPSKAGNGRCDLVMKKRIIISGTI